MKSTISLTELCFGQYLIPCFWDTNTFSKFLSGSTFGGKRCLVTTAGPNNLAGLWTTENELPAWCLHPHVLPEWDRCTELVRPGLSPQHQFAGPLRPGTTNPSKITTVSYKRAGKSCKTCPDTFLLLTAAEIRWVFSSCQLCTELPGCGFSECCIETVESSHSPMLCPSSQNIWPSAVPLSSKATVSPTKFCRLWKKKELFFSRSWVIRTKDSFRWKYYSSRTKKGNGLKKTLPTPPKSIKKHPSVASRLLQN